MTKGQNLTSHQVHPVSLTRRMILGAIIAAIVIVVFLTAAGAGSPSWPRFWMVKPLTIVPLAGAMGGAVYFLMDSLRYQGGWKKIIANILSLVIFLFLLWIGTVFGLDGTWWD